jgi:hypothetical protein
VEAALAADLHGWEWIGAALRVVEDGRPRGQPHAIVSVGDESGSAPVAERVGEVRRRWQPPDLLRIVAAAKQSSMSLVLQHP